MRPLIYTTLALLLAMLGLEGVREATSQIEADEEREMRLTRKRLDAFVEQWEDFILERVRFLLEELDSGGPIRAREGYLRANVPWFDAFYLWEDDEIVYPEAPVEEDLSALRADACMARAGHMAGTLGNVQAAMQYARCIGRSPAVTLLAASEAAELLLNADQPLVADKVMRSVGPMGGLALQDAPEYNVSARRLIILRLQHARAMAAIDRTDIAERRLVALAYEITWLDGALLEEVLDLYEYPLARDLKSYGGPQIGGDDDDAYLRAQRRLALYQEVRDRSWNPRDIPPLSLGPRLLVDQYGDPPYLLSFARLDMGVLGGVQLDQPKLLSSLLERATEDLRPYISIRDPAGRVLAGSTAPLVVETAFTRVLPHLRVGLAAGALAGAESAGTRALFAQLVPVALGILMGIVALASLVHTDRQQVGLFERQREFMTRVTHELKTPLAGIRLMAENLEMGAFRDADQRAKFARQIVKEAERLGARLDEVIAAASRPLEERSVPMDATQLCHELFERWRPLFEQQGATLSAELPSGPVRVHAQHDRLRDALSNLLDNALKYRHPDRPGHAWLRLRADRRWLQFEVEDDGIGVPSPMRKAIFERFRRVEGPGRGRAGGHGLGLAFVGEAARMHGGKVECREGTDGGSKFVMWIRRRS